MIVLTASYPRSATSRFDYRYYLHTHIPLFRELMGDALVSLEMLKGVSGLTPGSDPQCHMITVMRFASLEAFQARLMQHAAEVLADIPKFTTSEPVIQINEPAGV